MTDLQQLPPERAKCRRCGDPPTIGFSPGRKSFAVYHENKTFKCPFRCHTFGFRTSDEALEWWNKQHKEKDLADEMGEFNEKLKEKS